MFLALSIENSKNVFYPGQPIVGTASCVQATPCGLVVNIKLIGEEYTCNPGPTNGVPNMVANGMQKNEFLKTECINIQSGYFDRGEYKFPFELILPRGIPSSYKSKYGHVKYFIEAYLTTDFEVKMGNLEFEVFSPINLKEVPNSSLVPSVHSEELVTQKWYCVPEMTLLDVKLQKNAFVVGEIVDVEVTLNNISYLRVSAITIELYLKVAAKISKPTNQCLTCQLLCSDKKPGVAPYKMKTYTSQLKIPDNAEVANFQKCKLFTLKAFLEVTAVLNNNAKHNLKVELVLGHHSSDLQGATLEGLDNGLNPAPPSICPYPKDGLPYPKEAPQPTEINCPYPTENYVNTHPHPIGSNPLYHNGEPVSFHPPDLDRSNNSCLGITNPPYPKEEVFNRTNAPSTSFAPNRMEGRPNDSPKNVGMPSLPYPIETGLHHPTTYLNPQTPLRYSSPAPCSSHPMVGFARFTPTATPSEGACSACGCAGFAVNASHLDENRPSAPPFPEIDPSVVRIEKDEYADDRDVVLQFPQVREKPPSYEEACRSVETEK